MSDTHELIEETNQGRIERDGNVVTKTITEFCEHLTPEWYDVYTKYHTLYKYTVPVIDVTDNIIKMDYVEGIKASTVVDETTDDKLVSEIISQMYHMMSTVFEFNTISDNDNFFFHRDLWLGNVIWTPQDKICIIDPDSFIFHRNLDVSHALVLQLSLSRLLDGPKIVY